MSITVEDDAYPFVIQAFHRGRKPEGAIKSLFERMAHIAIRGLRDHTRHVVVAVGDDDFTAAERRLIAKLMQAAPPEEASRVVGAFAVLESAAARGVVTALHWLSPNTVPVVPARTTDHAIDLARASLAGAGFAVSDVIEARARELARALHVQHRRPT
jgi:hypothetical protein